MIPNGFDLAYFRPRPTERARLGAELGIPPQTMLVGLAARSHPMKDPATLGGRLAARAAHGLLPPLAAQQGRRARAGALPLVHRGNLPVPGGEPQATVRSLDELEAALATAALELPASHCHSRR